MGMKLITPKTHGMRAVMEEVAGAHQMRLQKALNRMTAMEIQCHSQTLASATAQDEYGQNKRTSRICSAQPKKSNGLF